MPNTSMSNCQFNQDTAAAKNTAKSSPLNIPTHEHPAKIADLLNMPGAAEIELPLPRMGELAKAADFS